MNAGDDDADLVDDNDEDLLEVQTLDEGASKG
jgi:hypothetical protein